VNLSSETIIEASADRVWEIVGHQFPRIGEWATAILASRPNPREVGNADAPVAGRVCETGVRMFPHVEETIVSYDEGGRTLTYVGAGLPSFVGEARNRWHVAPVENGRARVRVDARLELRGIVGRLLAVPLRVWLAREGMKTLDDLKYYVEHGRLSPRKQRRLARSSATRVPGAAL
jgi:Polyketide cyclase / dehydrase and lipid transport